MNPQELENKILREEVERLTKCIFFEQHWFSKQNDHGPDCQYWGPAHYQCLLEEYIRLLKERNGK